MTLDKSPSGLPIEPELDDTVEEIDESLYEAPSLPSRTPRVPDSKERDKSSSVSAGIGEEVARLKAVSAETSIELEAQRRDINRVSAAARRMEEDIGQIKELMQKIRPEAVSRSTSTGISRREGVEYPVEELELLTANITSIGAKANEIEGLKLEFEMMKRRIKRMEDAQIATQSTSTLAAFPQQVPGTTPDARITRLLGEFSQRKRTQSLPHSDQSEKSNADQPGLRPSENGRADRSHSESRSSEDLGTQYERPRSSTLDEPISSNERSETDADQVSELGQDGPEDRTEDQNVKRTGSALFVTPAKRHAPKATEQFFSYDVPIIDNSQDDDYTPHSRATVGRGASASPRVRGGRLRGRGRGGRPRTSLSLRQYGTPEWEKPDWADPSSNKEKSTGSETVNRRAGGVSRRGTGGGSYSEPRRAQAQANTDRTPSPQENTEVFRLTPRSTGEGNATIRPRDQRQRDSEGYLLTAKGTRDGRSKFWKDVGQGLKPNPNPKVSEDKKDANAGRHAKIMQQIFPDGVEEGKRRSNLAQQLFSKEKGSNGIEGEMDVEEEEET